MVANTIDVVKEAEDKALENINKANADADNSKFQIKEKAAKLREEKLNDAKAAEQKKMDELVIQCKNYEEEKKAEILEEALALKQNALSNLDKAIDSIIEALV